MLAEGEILNEDKIMTSIQYKMNVYQRFYLTQELMRDQQLL